jgi:hypothetical protein
MSQIHSQTDNLAALRELSESEIQAVSGGLLSLGLDIQGQSAFDVLTHWKDGLIVEQISQYQSVSSGRFSIGLDV